MSKATKRKHVTREVVEDFVEPEGDQKIVKVLCGRGNNLHEVESAEGRQYLASMPTKFRRNVWIKRGDYVVVEPIAEGNKVQAEIVHILFPRQIKHLKEQEMWPPQFEDRKSASVTFTVDQRVPNPETHVGASVHVEDEYCSENEESDTDDDSDLFVNPNRLPPVEFESSESSSELDDN